MAKPLVVVESPAKARRSPSSSATPTTCAPRSATSPTCPRRARRRRRQRFADVRADRSGKQVVGAARALKNASELYLATDENREEGDQLAPRRAAQPKVPVKRMVFHEITASAIDHAVNHPRGHRLRPRRRRRDAPHPRPALRLRGVARCCGGGSTEAFPTVSRAPRSASSCSANGSASPSSPPATGTSS